MQRIAAPILQSPTVIQAPACRLAMSQHTHARTRLKRLVALQVHFVGLLVLFRCCLLWEDDGARAVGGLLCLQEHTAPAVVEAQQAAPHYTPACCAVCIAWMKICVFSLHMRFQPVCAITDTVLHQGRAWGCADCSDVLRLLHKGSLSGLTPTCSGLPQGTVVPMPSGML